MTPGPVLPSPRLSIRTKSWTGQRGLFSFTETASDGYHPALRERTDVLNGEVAEWSKARPC
jgi:hypothetical protein